MIHAVILWLPDIRLPHNEVYLPPLTVRLEVLPKPVAQPAAKPEPVNQASQPDGSTSAKPPTNPADTMQAMEKSDSAHPLPKHAQLTFVVYSGADFFRIGELRHQLDIHRDRYTLKATKPNCRTEQLVE